MAETAKPMGIKLLTNMYYLALQVKEWNLCPSSISISTGMQGIATSAFIDILLQGIARSG